MCRMDYENKVNLEIPDEIPAEAMIEVSKVGVG